MTAGVSHRITLAGAMSVVMHGSIVLLLLALVGQHAVERAPIIELTEVQVVKPPVPPVPPPPIASAAAGAKATSTKPGGGKVARGRSVTQAPPVDDDPLADLAVSYDRPGPAEGQGHASGLGALVSANHGAGGGGTGASGTGTGSGVVPRRAPRPKHGYPESKVAAVRQFAGSRIEAELTIDPKGRVIGVRVIKGVEAKLDERVTAIARGFEFEPATDEHGARVIGHVRWVFVIVEDGENPDDMPFAWRPARPIF